MPNSAFRADFRWRPLERLALPPVVRDWLADPGSLTARLRRHGTFRVAHGGSRILAPNTDEKRLLGDSGRRAALIREVTLLLDDEPVVEARSVLPLASLAGANRGLANMGIRSLGSELYRRPAARRDRVWVRHGDTPGGGGPTWGRQSRFLKRGRPLLVAEYFLPALWERLGQRSAPGLP